MTNDHKSAVSKFSRGYKSLVNLFNVCLVSFCFSSDWTSLSTKTLQSSQHAEFVEVKFKKVPARFVRIEYLRDDSKWAGWGNIYEVEIYQR